MNCLAGLPEYFNLNEQSKKQHTGIKNKKYFTGKEQVKMQEYKNKVNDLALAAQTG